MKARMRQVENYDSRSRNGFLRHGEIEARIMLTGGRQPSRGYRTYRRKGEIIYSIKHSANIY